MDNYNDMAGETADTQPHDVKRPMKTTPIKFGFIMSSNAAFDFYMDATGQVPPKMPAGKNTLVTPFTVRDEDGIERAAALVYQTGFEATPEEEANGDEASGLSVIIAMDAPVDQGRDAIEEFLGRMLK